MRARDFIDEYKVDNVKGLGAVPNNQEVDYFGMRVLMKPSMFLKLATKLEMPVSVDYIEKHLKDGGALGSPFLSVIIPPEWDDGDFSKFAEVSSHEGRNRMMAIQKVEGDEPVEVHIFPRNGLRARDLTPEFVKALNRGLVAERSSDVVSGPIFIKI